MQSLFNVAAGGRAYVKEESVRFKAVKVKISF
jgi:hypothetical protein